MGWEVNPLGPGAEAAQGLYSGAGGAQRAPGTLRAKRPPGPLLPCVHLPQSFPDDFSSLRISFCAKRGFCHFKKMLKPLELFLIISFEKSAPERRVWGRPQTRMLKLETEQTTVTFLNERLLSV